MKLNKKGQAAYDRMERYYNRERAWLEAHPEDPLHDELGWSIIDNGDYVRDFEDECALLVFGYGDKALVHLEVYADTCEHGWLEEYAFGHTTKEYYDEVSTYFEEEMCGFLTDDEKMHDFFRISKEEFLFSYSYLTEEEYDMTVADIKEWLKKVEEE